MASLVDWEVLIWMTIMAQGPDNGIGGKIGMNNKKQEDLKEEEFSGQFNVRIPRDTHRNFAMQAEVKGCSLNRMITDILLKNVIRFAQSDDVWVLTHIHSSAGSGTSELIYVNSIGEKVTLEFWELESDFPDYFDSKILSALAQNFIKNKFFRSTLDPKCKFVPRYKCMFESNVENDQYIGEVQD